MKGVTSEFVEEISNPTHKIIMVLGGTDVGKSHLIENIAEFLSSSFKVGIVDIDMGQSHLGPPSTIGWGILNEGFKRWEDIEVRDIFFVGDTTAFKNLLPTITGAERITEKAKSLSEKILIDTTGLIEGHIGRILKWNLIEIIRPDVIVTLQRGNELEHITEPYRNSKAFKILNLPSPRETKEKSMKTRKNYRKGMFQRYFENSKVLTLSSENVSVRSYNGLLPETITDLNNRVVSLRDFYEEDIALGIISGYDFGKGIFSVITPLENPDEVRSVIIGGIVIE